ASPVAEVVTASCGIAVTSGRSLDRSEHLIDAADKALYQAKADGRDLVVHAPESDDRVAESA
ncbi:MAG: GGDEF domain-containing protein, partial [Actinomycetales bacterium]|nr:GGDEF domain-containing protein [Actinomycetales bacterium]